jgi:hypothetical protein
VVMSVVQRSPRTSPGALRAARLRVAAVQVEEFRIREAAQIEQLHKSQAASTNQRATSQSRAVPSGNSPHDALAVGRERPAIDDAGAPLERRLQRPRRPRAAQSLTLSRRVHCRRNTHRWTCPSTSSVLEIVQSTRLTLLLHLRVDANALVPCRPHVCAISTEERSSETFQTFSS